MRITDNIKKNFVMWAAVLGAAATSFIIPPDGQYASYFDMRTLSCLYCVLGTVCALRNIDFFYILAGRIVMRFGNLRMCASALVFITFAGSMLIANDMALLTFLPLGYHILRTTGREGYMAYIFILQNIAANLGGMLTPFGNPQNLYLYSKFDIPAGEFISIMLPPFVVSIVLIALCCLFIKAEPLTMKEEVPGTDRRRATVYFVLFALSILMVFRTVPCAAGVAAVTAVLLITDSKALRDIDYPLLMTFVSFFIFAGNLARMEAVRSFFSYLLAKGVMVVSICCCQIMSNVPTAVLLSRFTDDYSHLLPGVNIGGAGTLIASLASLITFREYMKHNPGRGVFYTAVFTAMNFAFVIILTVFMIWMEG